MHVDAVARAAEGELHAVVDQPLAMGARAGADLVQQLDRAFLEHAGADPASTYSPVCRSRMTLSMPQE